MINIFNFFSLSEKNQSFDINFVIKMFYNHRVSQKFKYIFQEKHFVGNQKLILWPEYRIKKIFFIFSKYLKKLFFRVGVKMDVYVISGLRVNEGF